MKPRIVVRNFTGTNCVSCGKKIGSAYKGCTPGRKNLHFVAVTRVFKDHKLDVRGTACSPCASALNVLKSDLETPYPDTYNPEIVQSYAY